MKDERDDSNIDPSKMSVADSELAGLKVNAGALEQSIKAMEANPNHSKKVLAGEKRALANINARIKEIEPKATVSSKEPRV